MNTLEVRGLHASIGGSRILRGISFDVPEKSVFCLMGRNGVGKTSTLKAIVGLLGTEAGTVKLGGQVLNVHIEGKAEQKEHIRIPVGIGISSALVYLLRLWMVYGFRDGWLDLIKPILIGACGYGIYRAMVADLDGASGMRPEIRATHGVAYVPQGREIFPFLTVEENLHIGPIARGKKLDSALERIYTLFPILKEFLARKGGMLSGGQQQQLAIARALLTEPKLLILDEPTEGIQPNIIDQIGDAIKMLREEGKMSILLVEQYLDFCKELGDNFAILERGAVAATGPMTGLSDEMIKTYLQV